MSALSGFPDSLCLERAQMHASIHVGSLFKRKETIRKTSLDMAGEIFYTTTLRN